jgi:hypothetical protein
MNKLLLILILILSYLSWTKADDIRDFQIEGMSIGDSALEYYNKKELRKFDKTYYPKSKKFYLREKMSNKFETYDGVQFAFKRKDNSYQIYGIKGFIFFETNFQKCLNKMNEIENELDIILIKSKKTKNEGWKDPSDPSGRTKRWQIRYVLNNDEGLISLECIDWSEKITKNDGFADNLNITVYSKDYEKFVRYEAY